ncbi:MAG: glycosyltransferase [Oscillospiraceae bacterium]|nr:glycosyltransferase [Oscillospiraceae bacterium]
MKVFVINSVFGIRSTGRICGDIAAQLHECGHECRSAYGRAHVPEQYKQYAVSVGSRAGVVMHALCARIFDTAGLGSRRATRKLVEQIREYDPDIIHLHNLHGYYLNVKILFDYLKEADKPVVWTLHDCWSFTGHCAHFAAADCGKWRTQCGDCPLKTRYPASLVMDRSAKNFQEKRAAFTGVKNLTLVSPSRWLAELAGKSFLSEYPVRVIPNGIDTDIFKPTPGEMRQRYHLEDKKIVMGAASAWDESKGLSDLLRLAQMLPEEYAVVLVGLTHKQRRRLPANVTGIDCTDSPRTLAQLYTAADVFVNPTYEDTYPTVNLEAQACGTPVITYRTGGSPESVPEQNVVETGDVHALAEKILSGTAGCSKDTDCRREQMAERYIALYHKMLESKTD